MEKNRFNYPELRSEIRKYGPLTNLKQLIDRMEELYGENIIISEKQDGVIVSYGARKLKQNIEAMAAALADLGLKGANIALIGENSCSWIVSYFAIILSGNVAVPLDKELTDEGIVKMTTMGDAQAFIYSSTFSSCAKKVKAHCPEVKYFIGMRDHLKDENCYTVFDLMKDGRKILRNKNAAYHSIKMEPDKMCEIIFTSGTTGANKGVMISQTNICTVVNAIAEMFPIRPVSFSVLPISHTYEKNCNVLGAMYLGAKICFNDSLKYLVSNMDLFKPHMSCMVPLFLDTLYKNIWTGSEKMGLDKHMRWGIKVSNILKSVGIDLRSWLFAPVAKTFGGNFNYIVCGGAPLRPEICRGMNELGINIVNGYGITECSPLVAVNMNTWKNGESVGKPIPGVSVKIGDPDSDKIGEILVKGKNVMLGYYKDEESTRQSFTEDGWFRTGDYGCVDSKGRITITGRKKNLIILDNGKNVHPEEIETVLMDQVPYIKEVVVHASEKESKENRIQQVIAAQIYIEPEFLEQKDRQEMDHMIAEDIARVNKKLPVYKQIHYIGISEEEFQKSTTKKIQRFKVLEGLKDKDNRKLNIR